MSKPAKILAIDDDPAVTEFLRAKLGARYAIVTTNEPAEAAALARDELPDLILCDVSMPQLDGYEVCRRIKSDAATRDIPVIFLTSSRTETDDETRGFDAGAVDYVSKTLDRGVLDARLRLHLAVRQAQHSMKNQNALLEAKVAERTVELEASREALRDAMHNLRVTRVTTGVYWVQVPEAGLYILCGSPPDVVKHLMLKGYIAEERRDGVDCETGPNVILLSDVLVQNGSFANLAEFPVLQMLYRQGLILPGHPNNTGTKPILIGSGTQVRAQLDYIYRGNYGLVSEEELRAAGLDAEEARRHMALKLRFAFGRIRAADDLLDYRDVGDQPVELARGVSVRRVALNRYEFGYRGNIAEVDLNLAPGEAYEAPYTPGQHHIELQYFGVIHCGEGDGWDLRRQSMGSIVMFQGRYYLVDAGPSVTHSLRSLGIDISEIEGIFHTHAHDDHFAGLPTLLTSARRIKYFATPLVRHSVIKKLSALMSVDERLFGELFEVRDLVAGRWNDCDGMEVMPLDSPHPVETTLFVFRVRGDDGYKTYAHWADVVSLKVLRKLLDESPAKEVLPPDFWETVRNRYLTPATLKKIDAGGGLIHGEPLDFIEDRSEKIVLAHRAAPFAAEELEVGSQASFGAVDVLVPTSQDYLRQRAHRFFRRLFPEADMDSLNALLRSPVINLNAGSLILRRGSSSPYVFVVLCGTVERSAPALNALNAPLALSVGALFGAETLFEEGPLKSTWRAASTVRLLRIGVETLRAFLVSGGWYGMLRALLTEAANVADTWLLGERLSIPNQSSLARAGVRKNLAEGKFAEPDDAHLSLVSSGELELLGNDGRVLETVGAGGFIGEENCLGWPQPAWRTQARGPVQLLLLDALEMRKTPVVLWKALEVHERRQRAMALTAD
ncbi:MAG: response regulator [Betaproteobacteria bacterium]|nr:response regulator [Betaproteobacteria bacterium]